VKDEIFLEEQVQVKKLIDKLKDKSFVEGDAQLSFKHYLIELINFPLHIYYIVIDTKYTRLHIERLMGSCSDRGRWKWIAETKTDAYEEHPLSVEASRSHIDGGDMFPRLYFLDDSLCNEIFSWLHKRNLEIIDVRVPKI